MEREARVVKEFRRTTFGDHAGFEQNAVNKSTQRIDAVMILNRAGISKDGLVAALVGGGSG
jgi:hypothetical protein